MPSLCIKIPENFDGDMRLDQYVASLPNGMNRSHLKAAAQEILLNGKNAKLSAKVGAKDVIDILWEDEIPEHIEPEDIALAVIYEDENVTVVNKKQGMVVHPAAGNWTGTLVNALLYRWGREKVVQVKEGRANDILQRRRPGIVHRLDKDTSGLIICAKTRETEEWLCAQFKERLIQKEYVCIVKGKPPASAGDVRTQIVRDMKNRKRFKAVMATEEGKFSRTLYHCLACYGSYSLIRVRIKTGRTHQIRVHMRYLGCPIVGDKLYGKPDELFPDAKLMLHARQMIVRLSPESKYRRFRASLPKRFYETVRLLQARYAREEMPRVRPKCKK
ncbi:MAG: RluA family pseudouridine synthase [Treponema sp.]